MSSILPSYKHHRFPPESIAHVDYVTRVHGYGLPPSTKDRRAAITEPRLSSTAILLDLMISKSIQTVRRERRAAHRLDRLEHVDLVTYRKSDP
jgi:hypothetical protein